MDVDNRRVSAAGQYGLEERACIMTHDWEDEVGGRLRWIAEDEASIDMLSESMCGVCGAKRGRVHCRSAFGWMDADEVSREVW